MKQGKKTGHGMKTGSCCRRVRVGLVVAVSILVFGCGTDPAEETAQLRGDRAFARGDYEEALAEYRLSLLREDPGTGGAVRAAHAYAVLGRVDEARALYEVAAAQDSLHADQAVSDLVALAKRSYANGDGYGTASAIEAAEHFRPGVVVEELALPLARHYRNAGEHARARAFYLRALGGAGDDPGTIFETALAQYEIGDCESALVYFDRFKTLVPNRGDEARWHVGRCSFQLSREHRDRGAVAEAIALLDVVLELKEPRTDLPQAYFDKAEILAELGDCAAALEAYRAVSAARGTGFDALVTRALDRIDEIRFGEGREGSC